MAELKNNINDATGAIGNLTRSLTDAENAVGKFFALGSESSGQVGGMTRAFDDLAKAAITLLSDQNLLNSMGSNAKRTTQKNFSVSAVVDQIESIYYNLLGK